MSKEEEIRNVQIRKRNILFLVQRYLHDNGLYGTATSLANEARLNEELELCDNVDLDGIYLEYASYYQLKFGKYPKIVRKAKPTVKLEVSAKTKKKQLKTNPSAGVADNKETTQTSPNAEESKKMSLLNFDVNDLQVTVKKMDTHLKPEGSQEKQAETDTLEKRRPSEALSRLQEIQHTAKGISAGAGGDMLLSCQEWQNLAELVKSTILSDNLKLKWSDICGNNQAIEIIKEAVLTPLKYPQLFSSTLKPWRSVLLHGPPGSGKTLLAKVLYAETRDKVTFFNITSSVVISKWRGESEKLLKILFYLAQRHAPSIIFFDEIEGLTSKRDRSTDHESSKRFKNELLQLMDGMEQSAGGVFILASTNLPWEIDEAFLRRFEKKLLIQLPNESERCSLITKLLPPNVRLSEAQIATLVKLSLNFTGDEIRLACKEIAMQAVRKITKATLKGERPLEEIPVENAFKQIKPLSLLLMEKHGKWQKEHGS